MLLYRAGQGRRVARLKGGDPLLFGRGAEEMEFLAQHGVAFEVVPGVTAALGATAYAGIPLSHRDLSSSLALVTSTERPGRDRSRHDWARLATATQTLVVYMGLRRLRDDLATLVAHGRAADTPAAVIALGTHPEQRGRDRHRRHPRRRRRRREAPFARPRGRRRRRLAARRASPGGTVGPLFGTTRRRHPRRVAVADAHRRCSPRPALRCGAALLDFAPPSDPRPSPARSKPCGPAPTPWPSSQAATPCRPLLRRAATPRASTPAPWGAASSPRSGKATAEALRAEGHRRRRGGRSIGEARADGLLAALGTHPGLALVGARVLLPRAEQARDACSSTALRAAGCHRRRRARVPHRPSLPRAGPALRACALRWGSRRRDLTSALRRGAALCDAPRRRRRGAARPHPPTVEPIGPVTSQAPPRSRGLAVAAEADPRTPTRGSSTRSRATLHRTAPIEVP
jgi:precorrin-6B methylase 1